MMGNHSFLVYVSFWLPAILVAAAMLYALDTPLRRMRERTRRRRVLRMLESGGAPVSQICATLTAAGLRSRRSNLNHVLRSLEKEGLVRGLSGAGDERVYELTSRG